MHQIFSQHWKYRKRNVYQMLAYGLLLIYAVDAISIRYLALKTKNRRGPFLLVNVDFFTPQLKTQILKQKYLITGSFHFHSTLQ